MTHTVTPEQAAALAAVEVDGTAYLAVEGERRAGACTTNDQWFPPADLAALVEQRCETCPDGNGQQVWDESVRLWRDGGCPDCHDGKPLHTIQQRCDDPGCKTTGHVGPCNTAKDGTGLVSLPGLWTYALLPVLDLDQSREAIGLTPHVWVGPERGPLAWRPEQHPIWESITVYGTPEPNHFVLAVTRRAP